MNFYEENIEELNNEAKRLLIKFKTFYRVHGITALIFSIHDGAQKMLDRSGLFEKASCSSSCSFCCHDKIMMPPIEAKYVRAMIKSRGIKGNKRRMKLQSSNQPIKWIDKACPYLLDENAEGKRLCSIYAFRPMVCRGHNSIEDPKFCNKNQYPNRSIKEGRIIEIEAITVAPMMWEAQEKHTNDPQMIALHTLKP